MASTSREAQGGLIETQERERDGMFNDKTGVLWPDVPIAANDVVVQIGPSADDTTLFCVRMGAKVILSEFDTGEVLLADGQQAGSGVPNNSRLPDDVATKIIVTNVLGRAENPARALAELLRIGRRGATYFFAAPDPTAEHLREDLGSTNVGGPNANPNDGGDAFAKLVADAGFVVENSGAYGFYRALSQVFLQICDRPAAGHPLLDSWAKTWVTFLRTPGSEVPRRLLNELLPQTRYIVARKPGGAASTAPAPDKSPSRFFAELIRKARRFLLPRQSPLSGSQAEPMDFEVHARFSSDVGLHDAVESGWFDRAKCELYTGFPIGPEDVVLDVGCGNGDYARYCSEFGAHIIFSDVDPASVRKTELSLAGSAARAITPVISDADPFPLPDASVSKIISNEVIEHVDDPVRFLRELARVGKPGALYLLAVPDPIQEALQHRLAPAEFFVKPEPGGGRIRGLSSGHLRTIQRDEFEKLISDAGLIVERHDYVGFFWALWFTFFWICDNDFSEPLHPLLLHWTRTWKLLLDLPQGKRAKASLDRFMPKSQIVIARKP